MAAPSQADVEGFVRSGADFAFEMSVRAELLAANLRAQYAGTYEDPVTGKSRQFDFRVRMENGQWSGRYCIECKNVSEDRPFVISRTKRSSAEAYHEVLAAKSGTNGAENMVRSPPGSTCFREHDLVGRSLDQYSTHPNKPSEENLFDKISQATSSCGAMLKSDLGPDFRAGSRVISVQPVVVVPGGRLWAADYDDNGALGQVHQVDQVDFYVGRAWEVGGTTTSLQRRYCISHVVLVVKERLVEKLTGLSRDAPEGLAVTVDAAHVRWMGNRQFL
jgi:hypothetical protein